MTSQKFKPNEFVVGKHSSDSLLRLAASGRLSLNYGTKMYNVAIKKYSTMKNSGSLRNFVVLFQPSWKRGKIKRVSACRKYTRTCVRTQDERKKINWYTYKQRKSDRKKRFSFGFFQYINIYVYAQKKCFVFFCFFFI